MRAFARHKMEPNGDDDMLFVHKRVAMLNNGHIMKGNKPMTKGSFAHAVE